MRIDHGQLPGLDDLLGYDEQLAVTVLGEPPQTLEGTLRVDLVPLHQRDAGVITGRDKAGSQLNADVESFDFSAQVLSPTYWVGGRDTLIHKVLPISTLRPSTIGRTPRGKVHEPEDEPLPDPPPFLLDDATRERY